MTQTTTSNWPAIRKSAAMVRLEGLYGGDIRDILLNTLSNSETDKVAANTLGIDNTTLSVWLVKLRIDNHAATIRKERGDW